MQKTWITDTVLVGMYNGSATLQNCLAVYYKTKYVFTHVTQQLHSMVTYSKETEIHGNTKFCTQMLIAVLSVIAPS